MAISLGFRAPGLGIRIHGVELEKVPCYRLGIGRSSISTPWPGEEQCRSRYPECPVVVAQTIVLVPKYVPLAETKEYLTLGHIRKGPYTDEFSINP